ncbi:MAG TPA: nucleotide pyrophosphohydrolase [Candidatus Paceibacterota bacterium]
MKNYQKAVDKWVQGYEEPYWPPLSQFARLAEEVGEVGRLLNHMYGSKPKKTTEDKQDLGEEIADVLFTLICLANSHAIDLDVEMEKILLKSKVRDKNRFKRK